MAMMIIMIEEEEKINSILENKFYLCRLVMQTYRTNWITKDIKVQAKEK
jgi:hypothetical protein